MNRRIFLSRGVSTGVALGAVNLASAGAGNTNDSNTASKAILFTGDGVSLTPEEYATRLIEEIQRRTIVPDNYSRHGVVEELEKSFAKELGKQRAIYLPTGTMANHLAMRCLTQPSNQAQRAIVPAECHLYNDSGDCAQQLSGINLVPLSKGKACFTLEELRETLEGFQSNRVATPVKALLIESPVRRRDGELVPFEQLQAITSFAKENNIKTHLDGARLYIASAYTGVSPKTYAGLFDTVFVSLNKYFNAGSGAILAGNEEVIDGLYHTRRMLGGSLSQVWPFAAMALAYKKDFIQRLKNAITISEKLIANLTASGLFAVRRIPNGSNIFAFTPKTADPTRFRKRLAERSIEIYEPDLGSGEFLVRVNETLNRTDAEMLSQSFLEAAKGD